jgi:plasmid segregation protein ParM
MVKGVRPNLEPVTFPNVVAADNNDLFGDFSFFGVPDLKPLVVEMGDRRWAIGESAYKVSRRVRQQFGYARYDSADFPALVAALLAEVYPSRAPTVAVTFSLPVEAFGQAEQQKERLAGEWRFKCRGKSRKFTLPENLMLAVPEAFGSLCYFMLSDSGEIIDVELAEKRVAVIDVGGYTTDVLTFRELDADTVHRSIERGVIQVRQDVNKKIKQQFNRPDLEGRDLEKIIRSRSYSHRGEEHDVSEVVEEALWELTRDVLEAYNDPNEGLGGGVDYDFLIFTGGGAPEIRPYLEAEMHRQGVMHRNPLRVPDRDAAIANVVGALRYSMAVAS